MPIEIHRALGCLLVPTPAAAAAVEPSGACVCSDRRLRPWHLLSDTRSLSTIPNLPLPPLPGLQHPRARSPPSAPPSIHRPSVRSSRPPRRGPSCPLPCALRCLLRCAASACHPCCARPWHSRPSGPFILSIFTVATLVFLSIVSMVTSLAPLSTRRPRDMSVSRSASRDLPLPSLLLGPPPRPHRPPQQSHACSVAWCPCDPPPWMWPSMSPVSPMTSCTHSVATLAPVPILGGVGGAGGCPSGLPGILRWLGEPPGSPAWLGQAAPPPPTSSLLRGPGGGGPHPPSSSLGRRGRGRGAQEMPRAGADGGAAGSSLWPDSFCSLI